MNSAIHSKFDLQNFNTLGLNSTAMFAMSVTKHSQIYEAFEYARRHALKVIPLGSGSNVVLPEHWNVFCLHMHTKGVEILNENSESVDLCVCAGEDWHSFVKMTLHKGWYGLENLALIPGRCGGAPVQNIGAYGIELERFLLRIKCIDTLDGSTQTITKKDCGFGYRSSHFKGIWTDRYIITHIYLRLNKHPNPSLTHEGLQERFAHQGIKKPSPQDVFNTVCAIRQEKLPNVREIGNVGSFFQNPIVPARQFQQLTRDYPNVTGYPLPDGRIKVAAASLLDICSWKGFRDGPVGVSNKHALCLINTGKANKTMVMQLAKKMCGDIQQRFSIDLEIEPRIY